MDASLTSAVRSAPLDQIHAHRHKHISTSEFYMYQPMQHLQKTPSVNIFSSVPSLDLRKTITALIKGDLFKTDIWLQLRFGPFLQHSHSDGVNAVISLTLHKDSQQSKNASPAPPMNTSLFNFRAFLQLAFFCFNSSITHSSKGCC